MTSRGVVYTTKELDAETWPDFEHLFTRGNGWDFCACMLFHRGHQLSRDECSTRAEMAKRNRREKRELVDASRAHGILVYANGVAVGWCQFGPREELTGVETGRRFARHYRAYDDATEREPRLWRVTCFVVDKDHRGQGVARAALRAVLAAVRDKGGGVVEAFPLLAGRPSAAFGGYARMFEQEGFETIGPFGAANVVVRRATRPRVTADERTGRTGAGPTSSTTGPSNNRE